MSIEPISTSPRPDEPGAVAAVPRLKPPSTMTTTYMPDPKIDQLAEMLIDRHDLPAASFRVAYRWKNKGGKALGVCMKAPEILTHFAPVEAIIWLAADHARDKRLTPFQLEAILYHELRHIGFDDKGNLKLVDHEFEGFRDELDHYGAYIDDFAAAKPHFEQAALLTDWTAR